MTSRGLIAALLHSCTLPQQGIVVFVIDGQQWTLDLREGEGKLRKGGPPEGEKADITLTLSGALKRGAGGCAWCAAVAAHIFCVFPPPPKKKQMTIS